MSYITPVIGSIFTSDIPHKASKNQNVELLLGKNSKVDTKSSFYTRIKSRFCHKSEILEKVPNKEHCVGKVPITAISQTPSLTSSKVEEDDQSQISGLRRSSRSKAKDIKGMRGGDKMLTVGQKRKRNDGGKTSRRNSQNKKPEEVKIGRQEVDLTFSMKRQLQVIIPRMDIKDFSRTVLLNMRNEEHATASSRQPATEAVSAVRRVCAGTRKRKFSLSKTPEKNPSNNINKQ